MKTEASLAAKSFFAVLVFFLSASSKVCVAQFKKTADTTYNRNNIKFNFTNWILYNNVVMFSYERNMSKHQSFSITGGLVELPVLAPGNSGTKFRNNVSKSGFTIGADYRFYLPMENKFTAPHGVYIGPYFSYYDFKNQRNFQYTDESSQVSNGLLDSKISVVNLGFQLGYQFIIGKRISLDLILFAPSLSRYRVRMDATGNLSDAVKTTIYNDVVQDLTDRFPLLDKLVTTKHLDVSGNRNILAGGLKYCAYIGYSFGKR